MYPLVAAMVDLLPDRTSDWFVSLSIWRWQIPFLHVWTLNCIWLKIGVLASLERVSKVALRFQAGCGMVLGMLFWWLVIYSLVSFIGCNGKKQSCRYCIAPHICITSHDQQWYRPLLPPKLLLSIKQPSMVIVECIIQCHWCISVQRQHFSWQQDILIMPQHKGHNFSFSQ